MRTTRLVLCAAVLAMACRPMETDEQRAARMQADTDSARAAISASMAGFMTHFNAGHADSLGQYYAENTVVMPPNEPTVNGRAGVVEWATRGFSMMPGQQLHLTVQNVTVNGDLAVVRGRYHFTGTMGGQAIADSGKTLSHWHKVDGRWVNAEDIWNSDVPVPPPPSRRRG